MQDALFHVHADQHGSDLTNYTIPSFGTLSLVFVAEPPNPAPTLWPQPASSSKISGRPSRLPIPKNPRVCAGPQAAQHQRGTHPGARGACSESGPCWGSGSAAVGVSGASHLPPHLGSALAPPAAGGGRPARPPLNAARCWHLPPGATQRSTRAFHKLIS